MEGAIPCHKHLDRRNRFNEHHTAVDSQPNLSRLYVPIHCQTRPAYSRNQSTPSTLIKNISRLVTMPSKAVATISVIANTPSHSAIMHFTSYLLLVYPPYSIILGRNNRWFSFIPQSLRASTSPWYNFSVLLRQKQQQRNHNTDYEAGPVWGMYFFYLFCLFGGFVCRHFLFSACRHGFVSSKKETRSNSHCLIDWITIPSARKGKIERTEIQRKWMERSTVHYPPGAISLLSCFFYSTKPPSILTAFPCMEGTWMKKQRRLMSRCERIKYSVSPLFLIFVCVPFFFLLSFFLSPLAEEKKDNWIPHRICSKNRRIGCLCMHSPIPWHHAECFVIPPSLSSVPLYLPPAEKIVPRLGQRAGKERQSWRRIGRRVKHMDSQIALKSVPTYPLLSQTNGCFIALVYPLIRVPLIFPFVLLSSPYRKHGQKNARKMNQVCMYSRCWLFVLCCVIDYIAMSQKS